MAESTHSLDLESSSSQYCNVTPASIGNAGTIEFWIKPEFTPSTATTEYYVFDSTAGSNRNLFYKNTTADCWGLFLGGSSMTDGAGSLEGLVDDAVWTHVAIVWDSAETGNNRVIVYKNGSEFEKVDADPAGSTPTTLYVGSSNNPDAYWDGLVDDFRIWSDTRTPSEISDNYCTSDPASTTGLVDHWKLDNDYTNSVGGANSLSPSNTPTFDTDVHALCSVSPKGRLLMLGIG